jgi:hypothetical protein
MGKTRKLIRRPEYAEGEITADERKLLDAHTQLWLQRSMRTQAIEPETITAAIKQLYAVAGLKEPRVVIVPSPLVMKIAGGFAAAVWQFRKNGIPEPIFDPTALAGHSDESIESIKRSNAEFHAHHINANAADKATDSIREATTKESSQVQLSTKLIPTSWPIRFPTAPVIAKMVHHTCGVTDGLSIMGTG